VRAGIEPEQAFLLFALEVDQETLKSVLVRLNIGGST
jgi:hypothetical protein